MKKLMLFSFITLALNSCGKDFCNASPVCINPSGSLPSVSTHNYPDIFDIRQGETATVLLPLNFGEVPVNEYLVWAKNATAKANPDPLVIYDDGSIIVRIPANPFKADQTLNTSLLITVSPTATPRKFTTPFLYFSRVAQPKAVPGNVLFLVNILSKQ